MQSEDDLKEFAKESQMNRYYGINFDNLGNEKNTIEFRLANGTVDHETWIENINLFGGIIKASEDLAMMQLKSEEERTDAEKKILENLKSLKDPKLTNEEKLEKMLSIVIPEEDRDIYRNRYSVNSKLIEQNPKVKKVIANRSAKSSIDVKKIVKKVFTGKERVTGQEYQKGKQDMENNLRISANKVQENNQDMTRD